MFYIFSKTIKEKTKYECSILFTRLTLIIFTLFLIFTITIYFNIQNILFDLTNNEMLIEESTKYIKLEIWGIFIYSLFSYLFITTTLFEFKHTKKVISLSIFY